MVPFLLRVHYFMHSFWLMRTTPACVSFPASPPIFTAFHIPILPVNAFLSPPPPVALLGPVEHLYVYIHTTTVYITPNVPSSPLYYYIHTPVTTTTYRCVFTMLRSHTHPACTGVHFSSDSHEVPGHFALISIPFRCLHTVPYFSGKVTRSEPLNNDFVRLLFLLRCVVGDGGVVCCCWALRPLFSLPGGSFVRTCRSGLYIPYGRGLINGWFCATQRTGFFFSTAV